MKKNDTTMIDYVLDNGTDYDMFSLMLETALEMGCNKHGFLQRLEFRCREMYEERSNYYNIKDVGDE